MSTIENVKEIAGLIKKLGDIELYRKIVELEGEIIELTSEKRALEEENKSVKKQLEFAGKMSFTEPFWYSEGDPVPYCPSCWESSRLPIHLHYKGHMAGGHRHDCPHCETVYCSAQTPGHKSRAY